MSDLLSSLGLEFVNPNTISTELKQLKPGDEPQIFSVILQAPGLENTTIKYKRHNFYNQIKRNIRCTGGACCVKADELNDFLSKLPEGDLRKRQKPKAQTRYILPVVVYQGKSAQAYGGPVEVRYLDIAEATYVSWDKNRAAVNEDNCPFYQRDFIMTADAQMKSVPNMTHLENRAKWLTDPALNAEVMNILQNPNFIKDYVDVVPKKLEEPEFLNLWKAAMSQPQQTVAEQVLQQTAQHVQPVIQQLVQPTIQPVVQPTIQPVVQPTQISVAPAVDMSVINNPAPTVQEIAPQPVNVVPSNQVPINVGLPLSPTSAAAPSTDVPFTPQNIINGSYNAGSLVNTVTPENIVNMAPVTLAPSEVVEAVQPAQPAVAPAPTPVSTSQSEISLASIGDLDSIINSLPQ
jgi:hypothetical protein